MSVDTSRKIRFVSKLFRAYRLYNKLLIPIELKVSNMFQSSFELTGYITD